MKFLKVSIIFSLLSGILVPLNTNAQSDSLVLASQFLLKKNSDARVILKNRTMQNARMNYNLLTEKMVFEQGGKLLDLINTQDVDTVYFRNMKFIPGENFFLEVILEAEIPLFFQYKGELMPPGKPAAYGGTSQTTAITSISTIFNDSRSYNLTLPSDYTVRLSTVCWVRTSTGMQKFISEKQFLKIFKSGEPQIREYLKNNKINFKKRDDLVKLVTFCNGL
jgi:hypothetical protein